MPLAAHRREDFKTGPLEQGRNLSYNHEVIDTFNDMISVF